MPQRRKGQRSTASDTVAGVRQFVLIASDDLIAGILNRNGLATGNGNRWSRERVTSLPSNYKILLYRPAPDGVEPYLDLSKAATLLGIAANTLRLAAEAGEITAGHPLADGPWIFSREGQIRSGATVGITIFGSDAPDTETMLSRADMALYGAKSEGRGTYRFFTEAMDTEVRARVRLDRELREAITSGQLFLKYQPQVEIDTNRIVGLEALVRWHHPTRGVVGAHHFIPVAEKSGVILPLGHWVMREACRQTRQWLDAGIAPPLIGLNLSGFQFKFPQALEGDIAAIMAEFELPATMFELEPTESVLMETSSDQNDVLLRLRKAGHRIAIDDFSIATRRSTICADILWNGSRLLRASSRR